MAGSGRESTHRPDRRAGANGFEVREAHRDPSAPANHLTGFSAKATAARRWQPPAGP